MNLDKLKIFIKIFQELEGILGVEKLGIIIDRTIGTFSKQYDKEEEFENMVSDMAKYIDGKFEVLDKRYLETKGNQIELMQKQKEHEELKKAIRTIFTLVNKS